MIVVSHSKKDLDHRSRCSAAAEYFAVRMKRLCRLMVLVLCLTFLWSCKGFPFGSSEPKSLPLSPVVAYERDCVWIIDDDAKSVSLGPICLSGIVKQVVIGDAQIIYDKYLYVSVLQEWQPEKGGGKTLVKIDPISGKKLEEVEVPVGPRRMVLVSEDHLYVGTNSRSIAVVDLQKDVLTHLIPLDLPCSPNEMSLGIDGMLYVSACEMLVVIDTNTNSILGTPMVFGTRISDVTVDESGDVYVLSSDAIHIVDSPDPKALATIPLKGCQARQMVATNTGKVYVMCDSQTVFVIDTASQSTTSTLSLPYRCSRMFASSNGDVYLIGETDGGYAVLLLDAQSSAVRVIDLAN